MTQQVIERTRGWELDDEFLLGCDITGGFSIVDGKLVDGPQDLLVNYDYSALTEK